MPEIRWLTPIYHPNISEIGMVCLGGYGTHWVPSLQLDELCGMLWDMARYHNYDIRSPYNREAALWVANQTTFPSRSTRARSATCAALRPGRIERARRDSRVADPGRAPAVASAEFGGAALDSAAAGEPPWICDPATVDGRACRTAPHGRGVPTVRRGHGGDDESSSID